jgi:hypothetical protein
MLCIFWNLPSYKQKMYSVNSRLGAPNFLDTETPHNTLWGRKWKTI